MRDRLRDRVLLWALAAALCAAAPIGASCAPNNGYLDRVSDALDALERGLTNEALASLREALAFNANDPLAHVAVGATLASGGKPDEAMKWFEAALELDVDCAEAIYGRALVFLDKREYGLATAYFCQAQEANQELDMRGSIEYVKALAAGSYSLVEGDEESVRSIRAAALMREGRHHEAAAIWKELAEKAARPGFVERIGCSMTFRPDAPVAFTGWPIRTAVKLPSRSGAKQASVSGEVVLRADLSKARGVSMVMFSVDNRLVGITNHPPYRYSWNTKRESNGVHSIKIQGSDADGNIISEKSASVVVRNAGAARSPRVLGDDAKRVWAKLWEALRLKPGAAAINYNLALCALQSGDSETAEAALERVMAAEPGYLDAADRLAKLYAANGGHTVLRRGDADTKTLALTFDDGPKANTVRLLDALKENGVRATFFVVGGQAELFPDLVKRMVAEGHEVQNHTYSHRDLEYLSEREITQEVFRTAAVVRSLTGRATRYVRPPGGHEGRRLPVVMKRFGLSTVFWTANCSKFEGTRKERMRDYVMASAKPGGIVLMHNLETVTLAALPEIIAGLRSRGYSLVTVSELDGGSEK